MDALSVITSTGQSTMALSDNDVLMLTEAAELNAGSKAASMHTKQLALALRELYDRRIDQRQNEANELEPVPEFPTPAQQRVSMDWLKSLEKPLAPLVPMEKPKNEVFKDVKVGDKFMDKVHPERIMTVEELTPRGFKYTMFPPYHCLPARMGPSLVVGGELYWIDHPYVSWDDQYEKFICPDAQLPDGETCPRCGGNRAPSGVGGGSWVHFKP
jgi:hypothetical protein